MCAHEAATHHEGLAEGECAHALFECFEPVMVRAQAGLPGTPGTTSEDSRDVERAVQFVEELELAIKEQRDATAARGAHGHRDEDEIELSRRASESFGHLLVSVKRLRELVHMYCVADRGSYVGGLVALAVLQQLLTGFRTFNRPERMVELLTLIEGGLFRLCVVGEGESGGEDRGGGHYRANGFLQHRKEFACVRMWQAAVHVWKLHR